MIDRQIFGRTGHESTRTVFGAAAITRSFTEKDGEALLELLLRYEVNHIDTAAIYGDGNSETVVGRWMERYRDRFFLATKTGDRGYADAWKSIRSSLRKLHVEQIDMIQLHNLTDQAEWDVAMGPDGALRACVEARDEGLVRFIGVTGHGMSAPAMHLKSLDRFPFDSVLLPWNYLLSGNDGYREPFLRLLYVCNARRVAVQTIKSLARRPWGDRPHASDTWYEPFSDRQDIETAVNWCLSHDGIFLNTVGDASRLALVLESADRPVARPAGETMERMVDERQMRLIFSGGDMVF
jgi:aryl-alcohol dehydrogenase-like predicted oxidoreductase